MKYAKPFHYLNQDPFHLALKSKAQEYFDTQKLSLYGNWKMAIKVLFHISSFGLLWFLLTFKEHSFFVTTLLGLAFIFSTIFLAFNVSHDAAHQAIFKSKRLNDLLFTFTFNLLGPNSYLWKIRHTNAHHYFVNIPGSDMDIESISVLRIAPHIPWKPIHRFQHYYILFFYSLFVLDWIWFKDFKIFFMKTFGNVTDLKHSKWRLVEMIIWKLIYGFFMLGIPLLNLNYSWLSIVLFYIGFNLVLSVILLLFFASSHISDHSHYVLQSNDGEIPHSFMEHQILTSVDYHPESHFMGFWLGGFNAHVAHHMFPHICSIHYVGLTRIIKECAEEYRMPYRELNFWQIFVAHFRMIRILGQNPENSLKYVIQPKS